MKSIFLFHTDPTGEVVPVVIDGIYYSTPGWIVWYNDKSYVIYSVRDEVSITGIVRTINLRPKVWEEN